MSRSYWLMKSEPEVFSFGDLKALGGGAEPWNGVRNYQARNFMRDGMRVGDLALFYHSNCAVPGVAGLARIVREACPDPLQFDSLSEYFDPKSNPDEPRWLMVDVAWEADFPAFVPLEAMKNETALAEMTVLRKGNRLSITPVAAKEFDAVCRMGGLRHRSKE